jgi:hypothetical protein
MNSDELKLTEYLHNIIENNMSLRKENDRLWKQKLEYIDRIGNAIEYMKPRFMNCIDNNKRYFEDNDIQQIYEILKGEKE